MPTSVLLAILAAAGLLALAPALTRRYDATERVAVERATSTARVLSRRRRRRTVPGPRPINPPRFLSAPPRRASRPLVRRRPLPTTLHRRRRVLVALVLLNLVELAGVLLVGPGFWIGFSVSFTVLLADLVYLRRRAVVATRRRRTLRRRQAWVAAQQALVRREHARRAQEKETALRRVAASRERARREAASQDREYIERYTPRADLFNR